MQCEDDLVGNNCGCPHCGQNVIIPNLTPLKNEPILGKSEDESAEAAFAQAAKDYRVPMRGQDLGILWWLGWLWLPLMIFGRFGR
jgi:hypothetical protein